MRTELGCAGHFIAADSCRFRRHTQIGTQYRVSTVGEYWTRDYDAPKNEYGQHPKKRDTVGSGENDLFETMVFATTDQPEAGSEGCGCLTPASYAELECRRYATPGEAQRGHETTVAKYEGLVNQ